MNEIIGTEIKSEEVSMQDIKKLCEEITSYSEETHKRGDKNVIKSKYTKALKNINDKYQTAVDSKDLNKLNRVLDKYRKVLDRYMKLNTNVNILKMQDENHNVSFRITTEGKGNVKSLSGMFAYAKLNLTNFVKAQKQSEKDKKEYEFNKKIYENIGKDPYQIMQKEKSEIEKVEFKKEVERIETPSTKFYEELLG